MSPLSLSRQAVAVLVAFMALVLWRATPSIACSADARAASTAADTVVVRLAPGDVAAWLAAHPEAQVVDVRTPAEVDASGRLAGALVLDASAPGFLDRARAALDPSRPTLLYCRSGNRSGRAADQLAAAGFRTLANGGGLEALRAAGLAVEPSAP